MQSDAQRSATCKTYSFWSTITRVCRGGASLRSSGMSCGTSATRNSEVRIDEDATRTADRRGSWRRPSRAWPQASECRPASPGTPPAPCAWRSALSRGTPHRSGGCTPPRGPAASPWWPFLLFELGGAVAALDLPQPVHRVPEAVVAGAGGVQLGAHRRLTATRSCAPGPSCLALRRHLLAHSTL
jgi:hypothetical protein